MIQSDNMGTIAIIKDPSFHARTKHIDIQHHYVREHVEMKEMEFIHTPSSDMIADLFTKPLARPAHEKLTRLLRIHATR